jgi:hypothetical protein
MSFMQGVANKPSMLGVVMLNIRYAECRSALFAELGPWLEAWHGKPASVTTALTARTALISITAQPPDTQVKLFITLAPTVIFFSAGGYNLINILLLSFFLYL